MDTMGGKEQAKNALVSHIRTRDRGGHGREGAFPLGFDPDDAIDYITVANSGDPVKNEDRLTKMKAGR